MRISDWSSDVCSSDLGDVLLGIEVPDDRHGCLQDIHWPAGSIGYFPTYTLGAMAAAQLFAAAKAQDAAILPGICKGDFRPLLRWLRANVHGRGSLLTTDDLRPATTGTGAAARRVGKEWVGT